MGKTQDRKRTGGALRLSLQQWAELRERSMSAAVRWGGSRQPDDDVQEAILRTLEAEARGANIQEYEKYISSASVKVARSEQRRLHVAAKHMRSLIEHPERWRSEESPLQEEVYSRTIPGLREIARELESCLINFKYSFSFIEYIFNEIIFYGNILPVGPDKISSNPNHYEKNLTKKLIHQLHRYNISLEDLLITLRTPEAVVSSHKLVMMMANWSAGIVRRLQESTKKCRLDILYRVELSRQELYIPKLALFSKNLDDLYISVRMPRQYTIMGIIYYLEDQLKIDHVYKNLIDPNYAEHLALDIIRNKPNMNPIDRWAAIVMLGMIYHQEDAAIDYVQNILLPIEKIAQCHSIQKMGMAFTWVNSVKFDKQKMIREKVYPLLVSSRFPGGLSQLPITVCAAYMGSTPETLTSVLAATETWNPILLGLRSKSYLANLGALAQLQHMPYHEPPSSVREELKAELRKINQSSLPIIRQRINLIPHEYLGETESIGR